MGNILSKKNQKIRRRKIGFWGKMWKMVTFWPKNDDFWAIFWKKRKSTPRDPPNEYQHAERNILTYNLPEKEARNIPNGHRTPDIVNLLGGFIIFDRHNMG